MAVYTAAHMLRRWLEDGVTTPSVIVSTLPNPLQYLGAERISLSGAAQSATLPTNTNHVVLAAEGGDIRYAVNGTASATSGGYVPAGAICRIRARNITSFSVYGPSGAYANLVYYQEG